MGYDIKLLQEAAAVGLKEAVKTGVFVPKNNITDDNAAEAFVSSIKPGIILSIVVNRPVEMIVAKDKKPDDRPAIDKQPTVEAKAKDETKHEELVDVTERLCKALKAAGYNVKTLNNMRTVRMAYNNESNLLLDIFDYVVGTKTAYAAESGAGSAQELRMVTTYEPAIPFTFVGLTREKSVNMMLDKLAELDIYGTFFVSLREMQRQAPLIRQILADGHELAISIPPQNGDTYEIVYKRILDTKSKLAKIGRAHV